MELIDIGINLTHESFERDRAEVLARATAAGVWQMVVTGASVASTRAAADLAASHPGRLYATAGIHPHHATELDEAAFGELRQCAARTEVVAIGECGLDYFRDFSPHAAQRQAFVRQLELAVETAKPVFLHQRDAHEDFVAILADYHTRLAGGVAHCFTGNAAQLEAYLAMGLHVGITGWICDERRGVELKALLRQIPAERLMLETDAPYLLPRDLHPRPASRRNEPSFLPHVAAAAAFARGEPVSRLAASSTRVARALFGLPVPPFPTPGASPA